MQIFIYCKITPHVSGIYRTHHQGVHKTITAAFGTGHTVKYKSLARSVGGQQTTQLFYNPFVSIELLTQLLYFTV